MRPSPRSNSFISRPEWRSAKLLLVAFALMASCASGTKTAKEQTPSDRGQLYYQMGASALIEGDATGALENLFEAKRLGLETPELHHALALAFHAKGEAQTALEEARIAVAMKADFSDANSTLGKLLMDRGAYGEAMSYLQRAAKDPLYRDTFKPLTSIGIIHYRKGEYAQSRLSLDKAIAGGRTYACLAYYYRGHLNLRDARPSDALHDYGMASKNTCAGFGDAHVALAVAYEKMNRIDEARRKFVEIQQLFPSTPYSAQAIAHLQNLP
ncbi:MAG: hypothetical protein NDJ90_10705 [Oligoflexia bacterium]|nr:hypothetical protein [Oligoflexia bacterium]